MPEQFQVEQALFGYREGHNLVAASVTLTPRVCQFIANVTDGSGPENSAGFEAVFTGLPVPETNYYALFCTWPAPEMVRPGCVWSHVLLLDIADLSRIPDLSVLRKLCVRPGAPSNLPAYERPLVFVAHEDVRVSRGPEDQQRAACVIPALYGQPEKGVVVLDDECLPWEVTVFGLWSQQWPRLRRNFSFSTGSLGDRRLAGVNFDIQIAPRRSRRIWERGGLPTVVLEFPPHAQTPPNPPWVSPVLHDLRSGSKGLLREFFFSYGSDVETPRHAFVRLAECFIGLQSGEDDDHAGRLTQLGALFPQSTEALCLKRDQLATLTTNKEPGGIDSVWAAVYFLLQARESIAFNRVPLDFGPYAGLLWQRKRADVLALLGSLPASERAADFLRAIGTVLTPEEVPSLWHEQHAVLAPILATRPGLATDTAAWAMPETGQRALWESLRSTTSEPRTWALTCGAMISAQCAFAERETVSLAGNFLAEGLTKWLGSDGFRLPSFAWRMALRDPLASALRDGELPPPLLALAAWVLPSDHARSLTGHRVDLQAVAQQGLVGVPEPLVLPTLFWITALGLQTQGKDGLSLLTRAFFAVYEAVSRSHYPSEAWELLAPILPDATFGLGWDRCRLLRRALGLWLRNNPSHADAMREAAPTIELTLVVEKVMRA